MTWLVNGVTGGNASLGTVSATGLFTAPALIPFNVVRVVMAVSQADGTKSGSANLSLLAVNLSLTPGSVTLIDQQTQQFTATVTNTANTAVTWMVNGVEGGSAVTGTISAQGIYTAPIIGPAITAVTVKAVPQADPTKVVSAQVILKGIVITVAPTAVSLPGGSKQQFTATLENAPNAGVNWYVNGIAGGNATVGTISTGGLYTAPTGAGQHTITATSGSLTSNVTV
ncbi:MAG TPA: hypothetical protein VH088_25055, partial [Terriglobales bacterium]|nr:hypothetical protein [Terriglobales bacterium]